MIDLDKARQIVADAHDSATITVSARWLRQAILEIGKARKSQPAAILDLSPPQRG